MSWNEWEWIGMDWNESEWIGMAANGNECPNRFFSLDVKSSIQNAQCVLSNMLVAQSWFGAVSLVEGLENCVFLIVSWIDRFYYRDILEQNLLPSIDHFKFEQQSHFMHDNDPKHTSELVKDWLKQKTIQTLP